VNRTTVHSFFFAAASAVMAIVPTSSAGAQSLGVVTPEQVRNDYLAQGFVTSQPITWWTDGSTSFVVEDPAERTSPAARVLMVIVYPDGTVAQAAQQKDAHLVPGYGPSLVQGNVALMQSTKGELERRYAAELDSNDPTFAGVPNPNVVVEQPDYRVALDFLAVVQNEAANL
jgi:hypothetical protein